MPDTRLTISPTAAAALGADARCRPLVADGVAAERVAPAVKVLVREAASCEGWVDVGDALTPRAVRWAVEAYYDQAEQAHGPSFF
jgi:hypothetical protein